MGMAAYGNPVHRKQLLDRYFDIQYPSIRLKENLYHGTTFTFNNIFDLAASVQAVYEEVTYGFCKYFKQLYNYEHASFSGGCSLNCLANKRYTELFKSIWVFPNSGDAGNSYGAGLSFLNQKQVYTPYLGYNIEKNINIDQVIDSLKKGEIVGIANGKAEFGPRALGNRSLIADPRIKTMQENVNLIKRRERFRPFAPAILEEQFNNVFVPNGANSSRFMTQVFKNQNQSIYPGITHKDGTSRVQTVSEDCDTVLRPILVEWYRETGIPLLLNTSLNIKGQPLVNDINDVRQFSKLNNITVF
jgi:carbamoyltransferase